MSAYAARPVGSEVSRELPTPDARRPLRLRLGAGSALGDAYGSSWTGRAAVERAWLARPVLPDFAAVPRPDFRPPRDFSAAGLAGA